jgi:hypothetical protein
LTMASMSSLVMSPSTMSMRWGMGSIARPNWLPIKVGARG